MAFGAFVLLVSLPACVQDKGQAKTVVVHAADLRRDTIGVKGMTCVGCEVTVEEKLSGIRGIVQVRASHKDDAVVVEYDRTKTNPDAIRETIRRAGYQVVSAK